MSTKTAQIHKTRHKKISRYRNVYQTHYTITYWAVAGNENRDSAKGWTLRRGTQLSTFLLPLWLNLPRPLPGSFSFHQSSHTDVPIINSFLYWLGKRSATARVPAVTCRPASMPRFLLFLHLWFCNAHMGQFPPPSVLKGSEPSSKCLSSQRTRSTDVVARSVFWFPSF